MAFLGIPLRGFIHRDYEMASARIYTAALGRDRLTRFSLNHITGTRFNVIPTRFIARFDIHFERREERCIFQRITKTSNPSDDPSTPRTRVLTLLTGLSGEFSTVNVH